MEGQSYCEQGRGRVALALMMSWSRSRRERCRSSSQPSCLRSNGQVFEANNDVSQLSQGAGELKDIHEVEDDGSKC